MSAYRLKFTFPMELLSYSTLLLLHHPLSTKKEFVHLWVLFEDPCFMIDPSQQVFLARKQYVLRLGYSTTIHGCQGMTLTTAVVDLATHIFTSQQGYVALSRVKEGKNLYLLGFKPTSRLSSS